MKFRAVRTCGVWRKGHEYEFAGQPPVLALSAIRAGHLVASGGWCAPSQVTYATGGLSKSDSMAVFGESGPEEIMSIPAFSVKRGGLTFPARSDEPVKKARKPRKQAAPADTLESIAEASAAALDGLRGPTAA